MGAHAARWARAKAWLRGKLEDELELALVMVAAGQSRATGSRSSAGVHGSVCGCGLAQEPLERARNGKNRSSTVYSFL